MPDLVLQSALGGYSRDWKGLRLEEANEPALASLAARAGRAGDVIAAVQKLGLSLPETGRLTRGEGISAIWWAQDQWMVGGAEGLPARLKDAVGDAGSVTDQTGAWAIISVSGERALSVLERLCMLDLSDAAFPDLSSARTVMEHHAVTITRGGDVYHLMTARSSARGFLHALETAAEGVCG